MSCVVVLLAVEWCLRASMPGRWQAIDAGGLHVRSPSYGWTLRPGFDGIAYGARTTVNALGYRGAAHSRARTERPRVVMVGDSIGFGYGVADGQVFAALLEEGRGPEVVNLSVPGFGTDQELLRLSAEGLAYRPDVVVVHVCLANDFDDNVSARGDGVPKPVFGFVPPSGSHSGQGPEGGDLQLLRSPRDLALADRAALWLRERSLGFHLLRAAWAPPRIAPTPAQETHEVRLAIALLQEIARLSAAQGARTLVLLHPSRFDFETPPPRRTRKLLRDLPPGLAVRDLRELYGHDARVFEASALDGTGHLNAHGHRRLAEALRRWLDEDMGFSAATKMRAGLPVAGPTGR